MARPFRGGGGKALMAWPLVDGETFFCGFPKGRCTKNKILVVKPTEPLFIIIYTFDSFDHLNFSSTRSFLVELMRREGGGGRDKSENWTGTKIYFENNEI